MAVASARLPMVLAAVSVGLFWAQVEVRAADANATGRVPMPQIPKAQGERCVADTDFMRRNHMMILMHQRDDTVHLGLRRPEFSLQDCLSCHAVAGADGLPVAYSDAKHFCRSCHDYAAVTVDCFECHTSRPESKSKATFDRAADESQAKLVEYLRDPVR
jgi:predicted CXXCH cytochrome family protein